MIRWYDWVIAIYVANMITTCIFIMITTVTAINYVYFTLAIFSALFGWNSYCYFRYAIENYK